MFDEPDEKPQERSIDASTRAREASDKFRMHAELAAIFEGPRKFDAQLIPGLDPEFARDIQRGIGTLEKTRSVESPVLPALSAQEAARLLSFPQSHNLSTNDYHIQRRPGEVLIVRWLQGEQVDTFYTRLQAHFEAALEGFKEDEHQALEWKQADDTPAYLAALDAVKVNMAETYLREIIRQHSLFVLATQAADEMNIAYLCDHVMGVPAAEVVGPRSAPPDEPTETDLAWFFKQFSLRGIVEGIEQMCFFTYLQKVDDSVADDD